MTDVQKCIALLEAMGKIEANKVRAEAVKNGVGKFDEDLLVNGLDLITEGLDDALALVREVERDLAKGA